MRYAVISDVHANLEALTSVLEKIETESVDQTVCLGDLVGYYANPNECIELVRKRNIHCITGNHDRVATGFKEPSRFGEAGRRAIYWTRQQLTAENRLFLDGLPVMATVDAGRFLMVHASLEPKPNEEVYLYSKGDARTNFQRFVALLPGTTVCFFGHTHRAVAFESKEGTVVELDLPEVRLEQGALYMINPGSVGQPRDQDTRASFLVFDSDTQQVHFHRVLFDVDECFRKAEQAGLICKESFLSRSENLMRGWVPDLLRERWRVARRRYRVFPG